MAVITKIDDLLEQFVGIRDSELATTVYDLAKAAKTDDVFAGSLDEQLADFEFPDDFVLDVSSVLSGVVASPDVHGTGARAGPQGLDDRI
jgi:hypothetical protein